MRLCDVTDVHFFAIRLPGRYGIEYDRYMGMLSLVRLPSGALRVYAVLLLDRACACIVY